MNPGTHCQHCLRRLCDDCGNCHDCDPPDMNCDTRIEAAADAVALGVLRRAAARLTDLPEQPRDGDCLHWEPRMRRHLRAEGIPAEPTTVTGWADTAATVLLFAHQATVVDGKWIVDVTARQFDPQLPARWVAPADTYTAQLAHATGCTRVQLGWGRAATQ